MWTAFQKMPVDGLGDLCGVASGEPQQLVVGGGKDGARVACGGPDLAIAAQGDVDDRLDGMAGNYRRHAPDRESCLLDDELGVGERDRRQFQQVAQPAGVDPVSSRGNNQ